MSSRVWFWLMLAFAVTSLLRAFTQVGSMWAIPLAFLAGACGMAAAVEAVDPRPPREDAD